MAVPSWLGAGVSVLVLGGAAFGVRQAMRSDLFLIRAVEVEPIAAAKGAPAGIPLTRELVRELASVKPGKDNLFEVDLAAVESRILSYPWVREVRLEKRFPATLRITAEARVPVAALRGDLGTLSYVSGDGAVFAPFDFRIRGDLPMLAGMGPGDAAELRSAVSVLDAWEASGLSRQSELSALSWHPTEGFRAVATYALSGPGVARLTVRLARDRTESLIEDFRRLAQVVRHLRTKSIAARQILMGDGRKIVVSTAPDS